MFYLNRTGAPEGPYPEDQIAAMIARGEVPPSAGFCAVGQQQWQPLHAHPTFARALAGHGAPAASPPGYGAAPGPAAHGPGPTQPGYGPGPTAPGYGSAPAQPGYGPAPAQPGYGAAPAAPGYAGAQAAAPKKKGRAGLVLGILAGLLVVVGGGAFAAYHFVFGVKGPALAAALPRNTELFVEVPNVRRLALDVHRLDLVDKQAADEKKLVEDATQTLAEAFDLSKEDASRLMFDVLSVGMAARKLDQRPEAVMALGFGDDDSVEKLLATKRFTAAGAFGDSGKKYVLARKQLASPLADPAKQALSGLAVGSDSEILVWFPKKKLLVTGSEPLVADMEKVLEHGAPSLAKNEGFDLAEQDFGDDARGVAYFDPTAALASASRDPETKEVLDGYFRSAGPITGALRVKDAGAVMDVTARFRGDKLPKAGVPEPIELDLVKKLPAETFAYAAFSARSSQSGAEFEKQLLEQIRSADAETARQAELGLRQAEQAMGVTFAKLVDSLGDQGAIALASPEAFFVDPTKEPSQQMTALAAFAVLRWKDEAPLKTALASLRKQLGPALEREATLREEGGGYVVTPKNNEPPVSLHVKFAGKDAVIALGSNTLVEKGLTTLSSGANSLAGNKAHQAALASLPAKTHFLLWVDAGRVTDTLLKTPSVKQMVTLAGVDVSKVRLTGDQRVTSALALEVVTANDVWTYRLHGLNAPALGLLGAAGAFVGTTTAFSAPPIPPPAIPAVATAVPALPPATPPAAPGSFAVGDKVEVEWRGQFYPSTILSAEGPDKFKIHYEGWSTTFDEVVPVSRIRRKL